MYRFNGLICGAVLMIGCGNARTEEATVTHRDSAGIEIVTSTAMDRELQWGFEKVLSLGGADRGEEAFYQVPSNGLAIDESGRIYVLDSGNKRVLVFDSAGAPVRTIGSEGDGPGEFRYPVRLMADGAGQVLVYDLSHRAMMRFDTTGSYLGQVQITGSVHPRVRLDNSRIVFGTRIRDSVSGERVFEIHRWGPNDSTTLLTMPQPELKQVYYESCGLAVPQAPLFSNPLAWDAGAGRVAIADAPWYLVRVFEEGIETKHVRRNIEPEPATREHAFQELGDGQEWHVPRSGECFVPTAEIVEARGIAEAVPVVENIAISPDGYLWVRRDIVGEEGGPVDVFDPNGEYVGTLPSDTPWPLAFGRPDSMIVLEEDELGVQFAVVYRIQRG